MDGLKPDIICLQETKVPDELFPEAIAGAIGFSHVLKRGMKGYNGVAILSRFPLTLVDDTPDWCAKNDCRHLAAQVQANGAPLTVHNFYVPAGGDIPDREQNPKFAHKLDFIEEARAHFAAYPPSRAVLVGDLNIAPLEHDVWSHKQLLNVVSHTPTGNGRAECLDGARLYRRDAAFRPARTRNSTPGGPTATATGRRQTAAAGWIMSG